MLIAAVLTASAVAAAIHRERGPGQPARRTTNGHPGCLARRYPDADQARRRDHR
jgi:hypothetical protein